MIKGLHGCSCHPFSSWKECDLYHKRKYEVAQLVQERCPGYRKRVRTGVVLRVVGGGYYHVKMGEIVSDIILFHAAELEPLNTAQLSLFS